MPELRREISPINDILTFIKLYRIMRRNKYDIVHFHSSKMGILGRLAAYLAGVKNIYFTVHGWGINEYQPKWLQKLLGLAETLCGRKCTMCLCVSKYHRDIGIKMGWLSQKSAVIYNGIDEAPTTVGKPARTNIEDDVLIIGLQCLLGTETADIYYPVLMKS